MKRIDINIPFLSQFEQKNLFATKHQPINIWYNMCYLSVHDNDFFVVIYIYLHTKTVSFGFVFLADLVRGVDGNLRHQRNAGTARVQGHHADGVEDFTWQPVAQGLAYTARVHDQPPVFDRGFRIPEVKEIIDAFRSPPLPQPLSA